MKKDYRIGNLIFFGVLLLLLGAISIPVFFPEIPNNKKWQFLGVVATFGWVTIWRFTAWFTWRHEIGEIFELTQRPRNSDSDVPNIVYRLARNANDPLLREVINKRIRYEIIGNHAWTARRVVGQLREESRDPKKKFELQAEIYTYTEIARDLYTKELRRLMDSGGRHADVILALIARIAVANANDPPATELPETKQVESYLGTMETEELQKLLIDAQGYAVKHVGEQGLANQWSNVITMFQKKYLRAVIPN